MALLNEEEQEAMDRLVDYMEIVFQRWGLVYNKDEVVTAIHRLQHFVIMHAIAREHPGEEWSDWYA